MSWSRRTSPGCTTSIRAEARGCAGRSAMFSAGSSKSKKSLRRGQCAPAVTETSLRVHAKRRVPEFRLTLLRRVGGHAGLDDLVGVLDRFAALDLVDVL